MRRERDGSSLLIFEMSQDDVLRLNIFIDRIGYLCWCLILILSHQNINNLFTLYLRPVDRIDLLPQNLMTDKPVTVMATSQQ